MQWCKTTKRFYFEKVAVLRGVGALMIFLFHFWTFYPNTLRIFSAGHLGLNIFFVLSGFLLILSIANKEGNIKSFFIRRVKRLVPLAIFFSIIAFILYIKGQQCQKLPKKKY